MGLKGSSSPCKQSLDKHSSNLYNLYLFIIFTCLIPTLNTPNSTLTSCWTLDLTFTSSSNLQVPSLHPSSSLSPPQHLFTSRSQWHVPWHPHHSPTQSHDTHLSLPKPTPHNSLPIHFHSLNLSPSTTYSYHLSPSSYPPAWIEWPTLSRRGPLGSYSNMHIHGQTVWVQDPQPNHGKLKFLSLVLIDGCTQTRHQVGIWHKLRIIWKLLKLKLK